MVIAIYTFIIHNFIVILRIKELILINRMYHQDSSIQSWAVFKYIVFKYCI